MLDPRGKTKCENCRWFVEDTSGRFSMRYTCRVRPPGPKGFPPVSKYDWCAEFKYRGGHEEETE